MRSSAWVALSSIAIVGAAAAVLSGCTGGAASTAGPPCTTTPPPGSLGSGPAIGVPPLLSEEVHPGWGNPSCASCHSLPAPGHTVTSTYVCAQCHGGNGACNPNFDTPGVANTMERLDHAITDDCASCHTSPEETHGFEAATCANCHFRFLGQRNCEPYRLPPVQWETVPPIGTAPPLATTLRSGCFGFPEMPFSTTNGVPEGTAWRGFLGPTPVDPSRSDRAVDFELPEADGVSTQRLSDLLATRPVWLQTGSYTCPVYQNAVETGLNELVTRGNADGPYADQIHFLHVYTVEAHPMDQVGPYGTDRQFDVSIVTQPTTLADRLANAQLMLPQLDQATLVVDALEPTAAGSDPVWCTYGTCPACSFLIGRDGIVHEVLERTSASPDELEAALDAFLRAHP